jgi:hypothetical protein
MPPEVAQVSEKPMSQRGVLVNLAKSWQRCTGCGVSADVVGDFGGRPTAIRVYLCGDCLRDFLNQSRRALEGVEAPE